MSGMMAHVELTKEQAAFAAEGIAELRLSDVSFERIAGGYLFTRGIRSGDNAPKRFAISLHTGGEWLAA